MKDVLIWINGAFVGAIVMAVYLWWQVATGKRHARPLHKQETPTP